MGGLGKGLKEQRSDATMPSRVHGTKLEAAPDRSLIRESAAPWSSKMTAPSRRSVELALGEKALAETERATDSGDGQKTTVMETMSLVEAERQIAKETLDGVQSGVREIAAGPAVDVAARPVVHVLPAVHAPVIVEAEPRPNEFLARGQVRRRKALWIVGAVLGAALALVAVSLARNGWSLAGASRGAAASPHR